MSTENKPLEQLKRTTISYLQSWGKSPLPPTLLATLLTALHTQPLQLLPLSFTPVLLFSSYLNIAHYEVDSAGLTAAWSGSYFLLARRRKTVGDGIKQRLGNRFSVRGLTKGVAMGVAGVNLVGGGVTYVFGKRRGEGVEDL